MSEARKSKQVVASADDHEEHEAARFMSQNSAKTPHGSPHLPEYGVSGFTGYDGRVFQNSHVACRGVESTCTMLSAIVRAHANASSRHMA